MLVLTRRLDQDIYLYVGDETILIKVTSIRDDRVKIGLEASGAVRIARGEIVNRKGGGVPTKS